MNYTAAIEALLYAAGDDGTSIGVLAQALELDVAPVRQSLSKLQAQLAADPDSGLTIIEYGQTIKLATKPQYIKAIQTFLAGNVGQHLSQAALEVLAIVAYQQPITRIEIDTLRGVNSSGALQTLMARQLLKEAGRKEVAGRPILYATSAYFLDYFGLTDLTQLPELATSDQTSEQKEQVDLFYTQFQAALNTQTTDTDSPQESQVNK
ncbi:segregation and condensation protein B [Agrilactobacillus composti DSM 18527 = JCM 14202]|uniref:Segregation and condensation protein B n=1 Tax=Agrilactobacillus composti DSM 18527 = JCM 14202 TaxID=1423734 RepID=X0QKI8_9LACO|nr:SMC-Scp complex subunit ScpB [Agrilactobacillus composti]KRM36562.1 segregation and condensation protein B [Agrilactobacillus composti DSM 18527 = JCM 14202]GAF39120.1 segregation and condensation protein B [Agrilactobacillus composti DSM 18527 = JCM 14202]